MMSLIKAAQILQGELYGDDTEFLSISTDTRNLSSGALYFALKGENFDGHDYLQKAKQKGAVAAVVSYEMAVNSDEGSLAQILVDDTRKALGRLAAAWRQSFKGTVFAVTGSNGKTTVKEMMAAILAKQGDVLATQGNFNNDIGLPLTLLSMDLNEDFAVIEMGANHPGEISYLSNICRPDIALITNAGPAHLEGFGSIQGVAEAKAEIYSGLSDKGVAIINLDDPYAEYWRSLCVNKKIISFALKNKSADVNGQWLTSQQGGVLHVNYAEQSFDISLLISGEHNAMNALAATTAALLVDVSVENIKSALSEFLPVKGRLHINKLSSGVCIIDDTYNANPASLSAGIEVLKNMSGEHWLVLGDMGELGGDAQEIHHDVGLKAADAGIDCLFSVGIDSASASSSFSKIARHFATHDELITHLKENIHQGVNVLIKGSRYMKMEQVVDALMEGESICC